MTRDYLAADERPYLSTDPDAMLGAGTSLLGPFAIAFDTPGLVNPLNAGIAIGPTIRAGSIIQAAWIANSGDSWAAASAHWLQIAFGSPASASQLVTIDGALGNTDARGVQPFPPSAVVEANVLPWVTSVDGRLVVSWNDVTTPSAGEGDVYALVIPA